MKTKIDSKLLIAVIVLVLLIIIEKLLIYEGRLALLSGETPLKAFLPLPSEIFISLYENRAIILDNLLYTLSRSLLGLGVGILLALGICYLTFLNRRLRLLIEPIAQAVNSFPVIGFAPLLILIFGQGSNLGVISIVILMAYFPIFISVQYAVDSIPKDIQDISRAFNIPKSKDFFVVRLSEIRGALISSLKLAFPASIIGATVGEWLGVEKGIGQLVTVSLYRFEPEIMYAALLSIVILNLVGLNLISTLEKKFMPYKF